MNEKLFKVKQLLNLFLYTTLVFSLAASMVAVVVIMYKYLVFSSPSPQKEYYVKQCTVIDYDNNTNTLYVKNSDDKVLVIKEYQEQVVGGAAIDVVFCRSGNDNTEDDDEIERAILSVKTP